MFSTFVEQAVLAQPSMERLVWPELGRTFVLPVPLGRSHVGNSLLQRSLQACSSSYYSYSFYCFAAFDLACSACCRVLRASSAPVV